VIFQPAQRPRRQLRLAVTGHERLAAGEEVLGEQADVARPVDQPRQLELDAANAPVEIVAELPFGDELRQRLAIASPSPVPGCL